ncbi:MAG TPA: antibiotic biosynthesis monooxygenase family protein [Candidatus Acidoferrales bacterium]|nr:antibiotic biosynthesis monooxygenase family protein [Candidatus Acidoferrales bacterium]
MVKVLIQRKLKPGKLRELSDAVREIRSKAVHAPGFISGETWRSIDDPSIHVVFCTWKSLHDWNNWVDTPERKAFQEKIDAILEEPEKVNLYEYE